MQTPPNSPRYDASIYKSSSRSASISTRSTRSNSTWSTGSNYTYHSRSSLCSDSKLCQDTINCICGRKMFLTQNPMDKYPPNAVLYCQQSTRCNQQIIVHRDWFYCCKSRTPYHNTKDGTFKICYSCSMSSNAKQQRIRKNHQLIIQQFNNKHRRKVLITKDTKKYILSSNSNDRMFKLLQKAYIDQQDNKKTIKNKIIKEGFMMKRGNVWNKSFQKRYFKLLKNKQMFYYKHYENGVASDERGIVDLKIINNIIKKGKNGLEIHTPSREWKFLCNSTVERDEWYDIIHTLGGKNQCNLLQEATCKSNDCCSNINYDKNPKYDI